MVTISSENGSISNSEGVSVQNSIEITSPAVELSSKSPPVVLLLVILLVLG